MSSNPMKIGSECTVSFEVDGEVIGEVHITRASQNATEMVVVKDDSQVGFLMFVMGLEAVQAMLMAERDPIWKVKLMTWKAIFYQRREEREGKSPSPDDVNDIPF